MADTFTTHLNLHLPQLGKKPWKSDWDFNFNTLDQILGGLTVDGSVCAKCAESIQGTAISAFIQSVTGDLAGAPAIPPGETHEIRVDHSADIIFEVPLEPIVTAPGNVNCSLMRERNALTTAEHGGVFIIRVENRSGSGVNGDDISWLRRGLKLT